MRSRAGQGRAAHGGGAGRGRGLPPRLPRRWRAPQQPSPVRPDVAARTTGQRVLTMLSAEARAVTRASGYRDGAHLDGRRKVAISHP